MTQTSSPASGNNGYAIGLADDSYEWYRRAAIKARRFYRLSETLQLLISAAIPVSAVALPDNVQVPATLGSILVVIAGLRSIFHWHDDYLRFSEAREAVEAERRLYLTRAEPYDDESDRDKALAASITKIERAEMRNWIRVGQRNKAKREVSP